LRRLIQHKREAYWFYRFLSIVYDRVNPLFWTRAMREQALDLARLDARDLRVLDVGAGTGFTTEGIAARVRADHVTMLDQSPHQLERSRRRPSLAPCDRFLGDAEALPFAPATFDRYVSAGSIEYWPDPPRAFAEAFRVLRPGGVAVVVGPLPPEQRAARWLADAWMLFPREDEYRAWMAGAGFEDVDVTYLAPAWHTGRGRYALAIAGRRPASPGAPEPASPASEPALASAATADPAPFAAPEPAPARAPAAPMSLAERARFAGRFVAGSAAGLAFVPLAAALAARGWLTRRRTV
jgi:MPBQ/MSBQ methyltransferase